jgi:hypothetical protein
VTAEKALDSRPVADPHILYVILSLDVAGLVLWVAYTLLKMPVATPYVPEGPARAEPPSRADAQDDGGSGDEA